MEHRSAGGFERELVVAEHAVRMAGHVILDFYTEQSAATYTKRDGSIVTDADLAADRIIRQILRDEFPDDAILTEEGADDETRLAKPRVWIVDPIDGTNQFVNQTGEFEVFVALVEGSRPVVAAIYQPTANLLVSATAGGGAYVERTGTHEPFTFQGVAENQAPRLMTSVWFGSPDNLPFLEQVSARLNGGAASISEVGISVRRLMPPEEEADALIGFYVGDENNPQTTAWEWDFAAPDLIVHEAGGSMTNLAGELHRYNKPDPRNTGGVIVAVDPVTRRRIVESIRLELANATS